jgi:hypothetical protein
MWKSFPLCRKCGWAIQAMEDDRSTLAFYQAVDKMMNTPIEANKGEP